MRSDKNTYTLRVIYNPPGFHPITIELSARGRGVIWESSGRSFKLLMRVMAEYMETDK